MEARSTTYYKNKLITFGEYKDFFTRGSDAKFVEDTRTILNYDNIELVKDLPNFNKSICTNEILNPENFNLNFNLDSYILPTDTSKCLINEDIDNIVLYAPYTFKVLVSQSETATYFQIRDISSLNNSTSYNSLINCYLRLRVELDGIPYDLDLAYRKTYTGEHTFYTYYDYEKINAIYKSVKFIGVSSDRDRYIKTNEEFIYLPFVEVYIGEGTGIDWIDNAGTQGEYFIKYYGESENKIPGSGGSGDDSGGGQTPPPDNALVVQSNWKTPAYLLENYTDSIIYGLLVYNDTTQKYYLKTYKDEPLNISNEIYFAYTIPSTNKFYAFNAKGNGPNSEIKISIYGTVSGGYELLYISGVVYDNKFNKL